MIFNYCPFCHSELYPAPTNNPNKKSSFFNNVLIFLCPLNHFNIQFHSAYNCFNSYRLDSFTVTVPLKDGSVYTVYPGAFDTYLYKQPVSDDISQKLDNITYLDFDWSSLDTFTTRLLTLLAYS